MNSRPLVSVCIPSDNGAEFIGQTLQAVLNQTFTDFELIVTDDRSTDQTVSIVKSFRDPRIRLIQNETNLGLGANWNHVLSQGLGTYVKLLCEDDLLHPDCLARQVSILENPANSRAVLTLCNREVINHRNEVVLKRRSPIGPGIVGGRELIRKSIRAGTNLIGEPAVGLFRRKAMKKKDLCDAANPFLCDLSLWAELLKTGDAFVDSDCLASFRISKQAASARIGLRQAAYFGAFARKLRRDSFYRIGLADFISGYLLSVPLCVLRNGFIKFRAKTGRATPSCNAPPLKTASTPQSGPVREECKQDCHSGCSCRAADKRSCAPC